MKRAFAAAVLALGVALPGVAATAFAAPAPAAPVAPSPTSQGRSPAAPDPHPPLAGRAPNGEVAGGDALLSRGIIAPNGAPPLPKDVAAQAWVLADLDTGDILAARDPHGRYQPASILKMLTAITIMPNLPGNQVVTISRAAARAEGSSVGLLEGAQYSVDDLFTALMLVSGNDAAMALAEANGGVGPTVEQMNRKAQDIGAYDTFVETPSGLDGWRQLTSAYDMSLVLQQAAHNDRLGRYDRTPSYQFPLKKNGHGGVIGAFSFANQSEAFLSTVPGALLSKTGFTDAAQHTYLSAVKQHGRTLGVVLMRNQRWPVDQWQQAVELYDWAAKLKPGTVPVGHLAGPIAPDAPVTGRSLPAVPTQSAAPVAGVAAPLLSEGPHGENHSLLAGTNAATAHSGGAGTPWTIAFAGLIGATVLTMRRRRRVAAHASRPAPPSALSLSAELPPERIPR